MTSAQTWLEDRIPRTCSRKCRGRQSDNKGPSWLRCVFALLGMGFSSRSGWGRVSAAAEVASYSKVVPSSFPAVYTTHNIWQMIHQTDEEENFRIQDKLAALDVLQWNCSATTASPYASSSSRSGVHEEQSSSCCQVDVLIRSLEEWKMLPERYQWYEKTAFEATAGDLFLSDALFVRDSRAADDTITNEDAHRRTEESSPSSPEGNHRMPLFQVNPYEYSRIPNFYCYMDYFGMMDWLQDLVDAHSSNSTDSFFQLDLLDIGDSYLKTQDSTKGHDIFALKISSGDTENEDAEIFNRTGTTTKAPMVIVTGMHPREYAPPALVQRWIEKLLLGDLEELLSLLATTTIYWVPFANPDGRVLAETDELWRRKNARTHSAIVDKNELCSGVSEDVGVDLNRNFPFQWGRNNGSSSDPCRQTFRGRHAASEPEVQALVTFMEAIFPESQRPLNVTEKQVPREAYNENTTMGLFLDIHSFGEFYIYPWGFQNRPTPNHEALTILATKLSRFTGYQLKGPGDNYLAPASGASDDWVYSTLGAAAMTWEIGDDFHQDCGSFESPKVLGSNLLALTYAARISFRPFHLVKGPDISILSSSSTMLAPNVTLNITLQVQDSPRLQKMSNTSESKAPSDTKVLVYLDQHPYAVEVGDNLDEYQSLAAWRNQSADMIVAFNPNSNSPLPSEWRSFTLGWSTMQSIWSSTRETAPIAASVFEGWHSLYFVAMDSYGNQGPASILRFQVMDPSSDFSDVPSDFPSAAPSLSSTFNDTEGHKPQADCEYSEISQTTTRPCQRDPVKNKTNLVLESETESEDEDIDNDAGEESQQNNGIHGLQDNPESSSSISLSMPFSRWECRWAYYSLSFTIIIVILFTH